MSQSPHVLPALKQRPLAWEIPDRCRIAHICTGLGTSLPSRGKAPPHEGSRSDSARPSRANEATRVRFEAALAKSHPFSWDTELVRMTVTKEAGHGKDIEEAGGTVGTIQSTEGSRAPRTMECPAEV